MLLPRDANVPTTPAAVLRVVLDYFPNAGHAPRFFARDADLYKDRRLAVLSGRRRIRRRR